MGTTALSILSREGDDTRRADERYPALHGCLCRAVRTCCRTRPDDLPRLGHHALCSAGERSDDQACGWRVLYNADGSTELWIANIAVSDRVAFRVLRFSDGEFTDRDGDPVQVSKDGELWSISVGREHDQTISKGASNSITFR